VIILSHSDIVLLLCGDNDGGLESLNRRTATAIRQNHAILAKIFTADGTDGTDEANAECAPRKTWQGMQNEEFLSVKIRG